MASSRFASVITLSAGAKTNSASLSTNFLMSQGQATRSTLTCSRVIHFIALCSFLLHRQLFKRSTTRNDGCWLFHLAFFRYRYAATRQENDLQTAGRLPSVVSQEGRLPR